MKAFILIILFLYANITIAQDTVALKSGKVLTGNITGVSNKRIEIMPYDQSGTFVFSNSLIKTYYVKNSLQRQDIFTKKILTADEELKKAASSMAVGITTTGIGLMTVLVVPSFMKLPNNFEDYETYNKQVNTVRYIGCGIILLGTIMELSALKHFKRSGDKFKAINGQNGVGLSISF